MPRVGFLGAVKYAQEMDLPEMSRPGAWGRLADLAHAESVGYANPTPASTPHRRKPVRPVRGARSLIAALRGDVGDAQRDPRQKKAHKTVAAAILAGKLTRPRECSRCGMDTPEHRMHAHHADYDKPMSVEWLCVECHTRHHAALRKTG